MDLFFDCCPFDEKERVHFHSFMQEVHKSKCRLWPYCISGSSLRSFLSGMHALKMAHTGERGSFDPVPLIVDEIMSRCKLLCFDEFQVLERGHMASSEVSKSLWRCFTPNPLLLRLPFRSLTLLTLWFWRDSFRCCSTKALSSWRHRTGHRGTCTRMGCNGISLCPSLES